MYNFNEIINRRNTNSYKWDIKKDELPMFVADMDFKVLPEIIESIEQRVQNGIYGYNIIPDEFYLSYQNWWKNIHQFKIDTNWILFSTGVVPSISSIVRRITRQGEKVLIQTPVYNIFFNSIINNGRFIIESPLKYEDNKYNIDFEDLELKLSDPQTTLMILCNPHNPIGKIWSEEELIMIAQLCDKYDVKVISDEIHCDITSPDKEYVPFLSVSDVARKIGIMLCAPTKAFNIAGLQTSACIIPNDNLRHYINRGLNNDEIAEPNTFAVCSTIAAFNHGAQWNYELKEYIERNKNYVEEQIRLHIPYIKPIKQDATYLMWIDISYVSNDSDKLTDFIRKETGLVLSSGAKYGKEGMNFIRMNVAMPHSLIEDGVSRFIEGVKKFEQLSK